MPSPFASLFARKGAAPSRELPLGEDLLRMLEGAKNVALVGVGNELHLADSVGLYVLWGLRERMAKGSDRDPSGRFLFIMGHSVPENFTGDVRAHGATHVVFVDAAGLGNDVLPGTGMVIGREDVDGTALATHGMPLSLVMDYMKLSMGVESVVLGVQAPPPETTALDEGTMERMRAVVQTVAHVLEGRVGKERTMGEGGGALGTIGE